jgi:hypothetical protein
MRGVLFPPLSIEERVGIYRVDSGLKIDTRPPDQTSRIFFRADRNVCQIGKLTIPPDYFYQ